MSIFPEIGSTVTNVITTKSGTAAKIEFSDGSSIYVKYDALILSKPDKVEIRSTKPIVHEGSVPSSRVAKHFANLPKGKLIPSKKPVIKKTPIAEGQMTFDNGTVSKDAIIAAQQRSQSRVDRLSAKWDAEHPSGEATINAMNGS